MSQAPDRPLASHVQAAIAASRGAGQPKSSAQAGTSQDAPRVAPHVQAALASVQPSSKRNKKKKQKKISKAEHAWRNLKCYSGDKARQVLKNCNFEENLAIAVMGEFVKEYSSGIRGHCSQTGKAESKMNQSTKTDLEVFNSWYKRHY